MNNILLLPPVVRKYLEKYTFGKSGSDFFVWKVEGSNLPGISMIVVIPAIMEFENIKRLLISLASNDSKYFNKVLVLFVVNNLASSSEEIKKDNAMSLRLLRNIMQKEGISEVEKTVISSGLNFALIDASSSGKELPEKEGGVGFARKLGMDLALSLFDYSLGKKKILACLDGDCIVEANYINEIYSEFQKKDLSAAYVGFAHPTRNSQTGQSIEYDMAIICYEIFLRYYVLGLSFAKSPYAFHTIGSTMACDYESYIKAEGMNKRKAAEDFYFMEKLAKIVPVHRISSTTVYPSPRTSWRVPFGTGQRVSRYLSKSNNEYLLYSPKSFIILRQWLSVFNCHKENDALYYLNEAKKIHTALHDFLVLQNFEADLGRIIKNSKRPEQLLRQKSGWFDGFRTLKFIHYIRDNIFPAEPMFEALGELFVLCGIEFQHTLTEPVPPLEVQLEYLKKLRALN